MANEIDDAADELYGVPLSTFTAERKRIADALKAAGSKAAAAAVAKLPRPAMSAWVVNQLWRQDRDDMEELLAAGARVRDGDRAALDDQRAALARLRSRAAAVLAADDHAASPATIQRIVTTLQALSALGTWDPDRPGRLVGDRDPPGFDVMLGAILDGGPAVPTPPRGKLAAAPPPAEKVSPRDELADRRAADKAAAEAAARKAAADKAARARVRAAEKALLERAVEGMRRVVVQKEADLANANAEIEAAEAALARARNRVTEAEAALAAATERVHDAESALASHIAAEEE